MTTCGISNFNVSTKTPWTSLCWLLLCCCLKTNLSPLTIFCPVLTDWPRRHGHFVTSNPGRAYWMMAFATLYSSNFPLFRASFRHNTTGSKLFRHLFYYTFKSRYRVISLKSSNFCCFLTYTLRFLLYVVVVLFIFITALLFLLYVLFSKTMPVTFISTGLIIGT